MSTGSLLSSRGKALRPSPTFEVDRLVKALEAKGKSVINLGIGNPPILTGFMSNGMRERVTKAFTDAFIKMPAYYPAGGLMSLREKVAEYFGSYSPEEVIITGDGGKGGLDASLFLATSPGDVVVIPTPFWPTHLDLVRDMGCTPVFVSTYDSNFVLTPEKVEQIFKTTTPTPRVLFYNYPTNPTGKTVSTEDLVAIDKIAHSFGAVIISDEAYREQEIYPYTDSTRTTEAKEYKIRIGTFSKFIGIAGERLGFMEASKEVITASTNYRSNHGGNPPISAMQYALAMLGDSEFREMRAKARAGLKQKQESLWQLLDTYNLNYVKPDGAFYVYLHIPGVSDGDVFTRDLLEQKLVALVPGTSFDPTDNSQKHEYFRIALGVASLDDLEKAAKAIREFVG